ncbi:MULTISPECIES: ribosome silencing factor [Breznakia]|uniref:Ribosomal silencing factor RsfS n=1 Tax=Breznakia blatticola TaxID=1754012 RepID=A0A4R8A6R2_9FIRM|nr:MULTISPECIES: ribosome silencing factor [Breznakia]MDH6366071.1 ribosome-associated protein [Breznakia sp. PH1-1]MDH6402997.1 ribosome-associated protein [Breznakia sp. PF1-11]MDH6410706.1 ribosome-associated protein [Breznakia sp. PFB1-11]MDH6413237.1 ribosome-associated protein [Breznakia sp. PFB1-14]MDH6415605.1 ribosome-associated protein [Breznakia sp. PFB1-4]
MMENKVQVILEAIANTKGEDVMMYDFTSLNPFIDRVIITSADNLRQVYAIASNIEDALKENDLRIHHFEGDKNSRWILIDADEVIVHVFLDEERSVYKLERLYGDLPRLETHV